MTKHEKDVKQFLALRLFLFLQKFIFLDIHYDKLCSSYRQEVRTMANYFIMDAKAGVGEGGMACGPVGGPIVAEAQLKNEAGQEFFISLAEVDGLPNFFKTDYSTFEEQLSFDMSDEEIEMLDKSYMDAGEYEELLTDPDPEWIDVFRYLMYLVRCDTGKEKSFILATKGCWTNEIRIPMTDIEEEMEWEEEA